ncbi:hypothetical protein CC86DRAFT_210985 [Ophiobolus disseminans]|uniref:BTB domain-containing protein n=1 Tax=Ophiobolus disseminans TaxID=1469910 RepID=A0A6A7A2U1_9PLEO|nr:hypothetical protein CC86DRAFT_210985 [Ophiobolus disseminans]
MNGKWKKFECCVVPLPEDESVVFSLYLKLLYTGKLPVKDNAASTDSTTIADEFATLAKLLVLDEKPMDEASKEAALAAISSRSKESFSDGHSYYPAMDCAQIIYDGGATDSPSRKLLVDIYTELVRSAFLDEHEKAEAVPKDFLLDLALSLVVNRLPKKGV